MRPKEAERQLPLFDPLSMAVLHVLEQHQDCVFDKHVRGFLAAICDYVGALSDLTKISPGEADIPGQSKLSTAQADFGNTIALVRAAAETKSVSRVIPAVFSAPEDFAEDSNPIGSGSVSVEDLVAASLATSASMSADMHGGSEHSLPGSTSASSRRDVPLPITNIVNSTASAKALLTARFGQSKTITDDLVNLFFSLFHNVCDDAQSLVEISAAAKQHRQMRQQQWRWENNGESSQRAGTGDFADGVTAAHLLLWRYADAVSTALETYCGALKVAGCVSSSGNSRGQRGAATSHHGSSLDIFSEHSLALEPWSSSGKNAVAGEVEIYSEPGDGNDDDGDGGLGSDSGSDTSEHSSGSLSNSRSVRAGGARSHRRHKKAAKSNNSAFRFDSHSFVTVNCKDDSHGTISTAIVALLASKIFANVLPGMISRMENSLRAFGMSISGGGSTNNSSRIRDKVTSRVSHCSHMLLLAFIENRSADFSSGMSFALSMGRNVDKLAQETLVSPRDLSVTPGTLAVVEEMNRLVVLCSIILGEMPSFNAPQPMRSLNSDRRAAGGLGGVGGVSGSNINGGLGQGQYHLQLQLDIERMFSRRIPVFCPDNVSLSIDALIGAILKAAFKACEQTSRTFCLSNLSSVQLSMDAIFLKQVCVCFLKDSQDDVESIAEQVLL